MIPKKNPIDVAAELKNNLLDFGKDFEVTPDMESIQGVRKLEGIKYDSGKLRWDLVPLSAVSQIVRVVTFGATKYGPHNWKSLADPNARYFAACLRHLEAWQSGEKNDPETGISHLAHAGCNILFLLWFEEPHRT